jgi:hypothetical protein
MNYAFGLVSKKATQGKKYFLLKILWFRLYRKLPDTEYYGFDLTESLC